MRRITINDFDYVEDPDSFTPAQTLNWYKRSRDVQTIVIHWWNSPDKSGTYEQTINYLKGAEESIHFVVSGRRATQMVNLNHTAFHAMGANPISIGIEVDPKLPEGTYEMVGAIVRFIRETLNKDLPLSRHSDHVQTSCPGNLDLKQIEFWSRNETEPKATPIPAVKPPVRVGYRVKDLSGKQLGAYNEAKNAWVMFEQVKRSAKIFDHNNTDVTQSFVAKFDPPKPTPLAPVPAYDAKKVDEEYHRRLAAVELLTSKIVAFLESFRFKK